IDHTIQIGELTPEEKLALFTNIMNNGNLSQFNGSQNEKTTEFLDNIPPFPLDVSIAAYYLKATNVSYVKYLEHLKEHHKEFATVQENVLKEATDYAKTRYGIITLSLKNLMATHTDFRELLFFISLLDSHNIPRDLLNAYKNDVIIESFIYNLKKYSLVTNESPPSSHLPSTFSIHNSTKEIILDYLIKTLKIEKDNQLLNTISITLERYIENLLNSEDLARMKLLVSHCENILKQNYLLNNSIKGSITSKLGYIYYYLNDYIKSQKLLEESLASLNEHASENQAKIAYVLMYLGDVYSELGNHEKAKDLCEQSLTIYKQHFSKDHVGVARALAYLGNVHRRLGDYTKARDLCEQSLEIYKNHFSENPTKVAWVLAHLGITYKELKDYKKAKDFLEESLSTYKNNFYENHARVAWVLAHLGHVHSKLGNYEKAKNLLDHSLTIYNNNFSENHVRVAWVISLLGSVYKNLENYEKSKNLFERSLFIYEKNYGKNHIEVAYIVRSLGKIHLLTGQIKTGDNLIHTASKLFQQNKHPESYKSLEILSNFYLKYAVDAQNTGDSQLSKRYKEQAIYYLNQTQKFIETHFSEKSSEIIRIHSKIKELENENK
ncbi:MAG: tetratricopeptide repeat protein, partial [Alphaproteobacteria bacterium]|nr:tetratricopeptide repeat protein [Alphaproteobacteria bacterium]